MKSVEVFVKYILCYAPDFIKDGVRYISRKLEIRRATARQQRTFVSKEQIHAIIDKLELGCDVMLHTSKMNIGTLEGGTAYVAEELLRKIDIERHTLLVSALPYRGAFADYLKKNKVFDVRTAPIAMGAINRYIAAKPHAVRSLHPTHSVVAIGPRADYYVADHQLDPTPFGVHSPYYKLIQNRGKVVLFGATLNNLTCVCAVEDMLGEVYAGYLYSKRRYNVKCIDKDGAEYDVSTVCHDPRKAIHRSLLFLHDRLVEEGIMQVYPIGEAEVAVIDIRAFSIYYLHLLDSGISNRGSIIVSEELHKKIKQVLNILIQ